MVCANSAEKRELGSLLYVLIVLVRTGDEKRKEQDSSNFVYTAVKIRLETIDLGVGVQTKGRETIKTKY